MNMFTNIDRKSPRVFQSKFFEEEHDGDSGKANPWTDDRGGDPG